MTATTARHLPPTPAAPPPIPPAPPSPSTLLPPLRGREDEAARALRALRSGADGGCALVAVEGPPGSGKTRFLDECVAMAERLGFVTGHRHPLPGPAGPAGAGAADPPRLIVLDDAHFLGEEASDALLAQRHAQYGSRAVVWLVARRCGTGSRSLDALVAASVGHTERITLAPLGAPAALQVAADILGVPPDPPLARMLHSAGGHPRLLVELVEGMREEHMIRVVEGEARLVEARIPERLRALLRSMLLEYPDECRQLLRVAAVLGRESTVDDLLPLLHVSPSTLLLALDRTVTTGVLTVGSTRVRFPNELLWRLIVDSVPATLRHALRRQVAVGRPPGGHLDRTPAGAPAWPRAGHRTGPAPAGPAAGTTLRPDARAHVQAHAQAPSHVRARAHADNNAQAHAQAPADAACAHAQTPARPAVPAGIAGLNGQEHRIVQMVAEGLTNKQIARRLEISPHTVNYHLKKLFRKVGVNSRIALLRETGWNDRPGGSPEAGPLVRPRVGAFEGGGQS
ncbi:LuxR C-terminal-related transcriptional regulator [Streptomyces fradiae]|uniref:helix-turn-helix transcriptional regulator n=1 Tax=Streptomyces fradiae TaxID=1906 RepID=UPI0035BE3D0D